MRGRGGLRLMPIHLRANVSSSTTGHLPTDRRVDIARWYGVERRLLRLVESARSANAATRAILRPSSTVFLAPRDGPEKCAILRFPLLPCFQRIGLRAERFSQIPHPLSMPGVCRATCYGFSFPTATVLSDAGDVLAELLLDLARPGHELETETVVDHGEAAGGERQALTVGAAHMLAGHRLSGHWSSVRTRPARILRNFTARHPR
jgi:hypothetical protein